MTAGRVQGAGFTLLPTFTRPHLTRTARTRAGDPNLVRLDRAWSHAPTRPWTPNHPDAVLARDVAAGILDRTEARLIGATRLEDIPLWVSPRSLEASLKREAL